MQRSFVTHLKAKRNYLDQLPFRAFQTLFWELVAAVHRCRCVSATGSSLMKVTTLVCVCPLAASWGGISLMTHNTKAEGTEEPFKHFKAI